MSWVVALPTQPRAVPELTADPDGVREYAAGLLAASTRVRGAARRVDRRAVSLQSMLDRRAALVDERGRLVAAIAGLRDRVAGATAAEAPVLQVACDDCAVRVTTFEIDLDRWITDLMAVQEAVQEAFARVSILDRVERGYDGADVPPGPGTAPRDVKGWWDGLARDQQLALIATSPESVGSRDGVPPWARDAANTVSLDRDLADWGDLEERGLLSDDERRWLDNARAAQQAISTIEDGIDPQTLDAVSSQLYLYDPAAGGGDGAIAVAAGDLATAQDVTVTVPGLGAVARSAPYQADRALERYEATRSGEGAGGVASLFWIGYDATDDLATVAGERLADLLDGLRDSRDGDPARVTAIGQRRGPTTPGHAQPD